MTVRMKNKGSGYAAVGIERPQIQGFPATSAGSVAVARSNDGNIKVMRLAKNGQILGSHILKSPMPERKFRAFLDGVKVGFGAGGIGKAACSVFSREQNQAVARLTELKRLREQRPLRLSVVRGNPIARSFKIDD